MTANAKHPEQLAHEIEELRARLAEAEGMLRDIQGGTATSLTAAPSQPDPMPERTQAEIDLQHSEARFRASIETMLDPFAILLPVRDAAGQIIDFTVEFANQAIYTSSGTTESQILGKQLLYLLPAHKPTGLFDALCRVVQTGTPLVMESFLYEGTWRGRSLTRFLDVQATKLDDSVAVTWRDITSRKRAEAALERRDALLDALATIGEHFLRSNDLDSTLPAILARLGQAADVSRVNVIKLHFAPDGESLMSHYYEWSAPGVTPFADLIDFQTLSFAEMDGWRDVLVKNDVIQLSTQEFPDAIRVVAEASHTLSVAVVPILCADELWGVVTFTEARTQRKWLPVEIEALRSTASALGAALLRQRALLAEREQRLLAEVLRDTAAAASSSLHIDDVLQRILAGLDQVVPHDASNVILFDQDIARVVRCRGYAERGLEEVILALTYRVSQFPKVRHAVESGHVQNTTDTQLDPDWATVPQFSWIRSNLLAPIRIEDRVIGIINLDSAVPNKFSARDAEWLQAFTDQAAIAVHNAQLYEATQRHAAELETLRRLALDLTSQLDLDAVLHSVTQGALDLVGASGAAFLQYRPAEDVLELTVTTPNNQPKPPMIIRRGQGAVGKALDSLTTISINDYEIWEGRLSGFSDFVIGAVIAVPVMWQSDLLGVFNVISGSAMRPFSAHHAQLLNLLAGQAAIAIRNAQLFAAEQEQRSLADALRNAAAALTSTLDPRLVMERILESVEHVVPYEFADIMLVDGEGGRVMYWRGFSDEAVNYLKDMHFPLNLPNLHRMIETRSPIWIADTNLDPDWKVIPQVPTRSYSGAPIQPRGQIVGFLNLSSKTPNFFNASHAERLQAFADVAAIALENAQLYDELQREASELQYRVVERTAALYGLTEHIEAILNNSSDAIVAVRLDGTLERTNPAFDAIFGYEEDQSLGKPLVNLIDPSERPSLEDAWSRLLDTQQPARLEFTALRKDGTTFDADFALAPIRGHDDQQQVTGIVINIRDITRRKVQEKELRAALEKERELNDLKTRFVTMVSHEFRTPLAGIQLHTDMLRRYSQRLSDSQKLDRLDGIQKEIWLMIKLLENVLALGRADAGRLPFRPAPLDLNAFCQDIIGLIQVPGEQHQFVVSLLAGNATVTMDRDLLQHVLTNLLSNAVKYSPPSSAIHFDLLRQPEQVTFRVRDEGMGIPPQDHPHIFTAFYRAPNAGDVQGTGLGLVIAKQMVERHGGQISFESELGSGTTFTVSIPTTFSPDQIDNMYKARQ